MCVCVCVVCVCVCFVSIQPLWLQISNKTLLLLGFTFDTYCIIVVCYLPYDLANDTPIIIHH